MVDDWAKTHKQTCCAVFWSSSKTPEPAADTWERLAGMRRTHTVMDAFSDPSLVTAALAGGLAEQAEVAHEYLAVMALVSARQMVVLPDTHEK